MKLMQTSQQQVAWPRAGVDSAGLAGVIQDWHRSFTGNVFSCFYQRVRYGMVSRIIGGKADQGQMQDGGHSWPVFS